MSDTEEGDSVSESLKQDSMSVSELDQDLSHDGDDMPSAEGECPEGNPQDPDLTDESSVSENHPPKLAEKKCTTKKDEDSFKPKLPFMDVDVSSMQLMTASYSEIQSPVKDEDDSAAAVHVPAVTNLTTEGTILCDGQMVHFIAEDLENKIRLSSPDSPAFGYPRSHLPKTESQDTSSLTEFSLLSNLEKEARNIAASIDALTEHLAISLHTISAVTVESLLVYRDSVCKTCDAMDGNIKSMYQLMAKCEELSKAMAPLYKQAEQVKEMKRLLDIFESIC